MAQLNARFDPDPDGITFHLQAMFTDSTKQNLSHDHQKRKIRVTRICGPVKRLNDTSFQLDFYLMGFNNSKRSNDMWLMVAVDGDKTYKSAFLQVNLRFPLFNREGKVQHIDFSAPGNVKEGISALTLKATSGASLPVRYYLQERPAVIRENKLQFTTIPPKARFPAKVTVVAVRKGRSRCYSVRRAGFPHIFCGKDGYCHCY